MFRNNQLHETADNVTTPSTSLKRGRDSEQLPPQKTNVAGRLFSDLPNGEKSRIIPNKRSLAIVQSVENEAPFKRPKFSFVKQNDQNPATLNLSELTESLETLYISRSPKKKLPSHSIFSSEADNSQPTAPHNSPVKKSNR